MNQDTWIIGTVIFFSVVIGITIIEVVMRWYAGTVTPSGNDKDTDPMDPEQS